jgi:phenylalanyl-tRNA synthetase beta chain
MKIPLSWIKDYVDIDLSLPELARTLTMLGLEVDGVQVVGLPLPVGERLDVRFSGLAWDNDRIVVAQIEEVMPHPNADRLVLCRLQDGQQEQIVLTGAPNLFPYKGQGTLPKPLKVAYAKEGARIYDGHQPGQVPMTLKRAKIRGVDSYSMVCSEKELGISDEHEGVIILDDDAPTGIPLAEYMGDAVFEISILPNMIRNACVIGVARELATATGKPLRKPTARLPMDGADIQGCVAIHITDPDLNPRFVFGLVRGARPQPSPYWVQRRLRLAGMRPINSIVDATNYIMLEVNQPLHAFDYDVLVQRAGGKPPTIITRTALPGEKLTTLDGIERQLDTFTIMVTDTAGALSLAGVMGGAESEVTEATRNVLLEGAAWNFISIRRTVSAQKLNSEAAYRFARDIHPALAEVGVHLCIDRITEWSGGQIAAGLVDEYPKPPIQPVIQVTPLDIRRLLGVEVSPERIMTILTGLEFECRMEGEAVIARAPAERMDIGEGIVGLADVIEEIARHYGYDNLPYTRLSDTLPEQRRRPNYEFEVRLQDILVSLGLQEVITYRMTSPEREGRLLSKAVKSGESDYVHLLNPITPEKCVMRRSLLASVLEIIEHNVRLTSQIRLFESAPVFIPVLGQELPAEPRRLVIAISGLRQPPSWDHSSKDMVDFYDLKGILEALLGEFHIESLSFTPGDHPSFHPGKCAVVKAGEVSLGVFGELHPLVKENYDFAGANVLTADLDVDALQSVAEHRYESLPVPSFPPVLEDIAVIVDENTPAVQVEDAIRKAGGKVLAGVRLFDIFHGEQIGAGKKSLAYALTYQAPDRTLTDDEAAQIRNRIIRALDQQLGAKLRS